MFTRLKKFFMDARPVSGFELMGYAMEGLQKQQEEAMARIKDSIGLPNQGELMGQIRQWKCDECGAIGENTGYSAPEGWIVSDIDTTTDGKTKSGNACFCNKCTVNGKRVSLADLKDLCK